MQKTIVTIYTRRGCHLCDEAKAAILASGLEAEFSLEEVNVDEDPALCERYGDDVPVVFINGVKVFKHRVDRREFKRRFVGKGAQSTDFSRVVRYTDQKLPD